MIVFDAGEDRSENAEKSAPCNLPRGSRFLTPSDPLFILRAMANNWVKAGTVEQVTPGTAVKVEINGQEVALYNVDGRFFATSNICPHQGGPLAEGMLEVRVGIGTVVANCPRSTAGERSRLLKREIEQVVVEAKRLGLDLDEILDAVSSHWERFERSAPSALAGQGAGK